MNMNMDESYIVNDNNTTAELMMENPDSYVITAAGIIWNKNKSENNYGKKTQISIENLPKMISVEIPDNVLENAKKSDKFDDIIETYVYNFLTSKFGYEVYKCSIWLPLNK